MSAAIDLNADLGEGGQSDAALMSVVTSCNIACGGHAGDADTMRAALELASANSVQAGAHPSFPDREHFGRTEMSLSGSELEDVLTQQVRTLSDIARQVGVALAHLKPHGALYNMAAKDGGLARSIVSVVKESLPNVRLVGPPGSDLERAAGDAGIPFVGEGFADRAYEADGGLRNRKEDGAVIHDADRQLGQALNMVLKGEVQTFDGHLISMPVRTICVHGDTPGAYEAALAIRSGLEANGVTVCPPA